MEVRILGPLDVRAGGEELPLGAPKQRAVLAVLVLHANRLVPLDQLIDALWRDPPPSASNAVQVYVSKLRKIFEGAGTEAPRLVTRPPGYMLELEPEALDLHRFERLLEAGRRSLEEGEVAAAAAGLREALGSWRGPALGDFLEEPFAVPAQVRLEELRLTALESRIEADLALGHHEDLVAELGGLVLDHPYRERLRGQLMLTLYRSGRQADALRVFHELRTLLVDELGLEPSQTLRRLERAILVQDPSLDPVAVGADEAAVPVSEYPRRAVLVAATEADPLDGLLWLARPLAAAEPPHELIVIRLVGPESTGDGASLSRAATELDALRRDLVDEGLTARAAAFTCEEPGDELVRFSSEQEIDLLLLGGEELIEGDVAALAPLLRGAQCDMGLLLRRDGQALAIDSEHPPLVVFGGADHDWAALELGAWLARSLGTSLTLAGTAADPARGRRDASRLLATASLVVQQFAGVYAQPLLAAAGSSGVIESAAEAGIVLIGLGGRAEDPLGSTRERIARESAAPTLFVRRGVRPGGLAPDRGLTRYTWSLSGEGTEAPVVEGAPEQR